MSRKRHRIRTNKLLLSVRRLKRRVERVAPRYRCARSKHVYTQHQLLVLLVLQQYLGSSYREFVVTVETMTAVLDELDIDEVPHFTTLHKFVARIDDDTLDAVLASFVDIVDGPLEVAIDSTGFACTSASRYYVMTIERNKKGIETRKRAIRRHIKQANVVETRSQMIVAVRYRYGPDNDFGDAVPTLAAASVRSIAVVVGDKGYDSQDIRRFIWYRLGAKAHIPLREQRKHGSESKSVYRRKQRAEFDIVRYRRRPLVETAHSVIKRTMRGDVLARSDTMRFRELRLRAIAYNVRREGTIMDEFY